jgi:predicted outer membrane repeat protein
MTDNKCFSIAVRAIALCLLAGPALQAVAETDFTRSSDDWEGHVSVGPTGCDYTDLQDAINDGFAGGHGGHMGVHTDYEMNDEYVIHQFAVWVNDPWIVGGFTSCDVGDLGSTSGRTTLDAEEQSRHFDVQYDVGESGSVRRLTLQNLELVNGSSIGGGALWIRGQHNRLVVELVNTGIDLNDGGFLGGGILISPDPTIVDVGPGGRPLVRPMLEIDEESHITRNSAVSGGGIYCAAGTDDDITGTVVASGAGLILDNTAHLSGGGIYAKNCNFSLRNGRGILGFIPAGGIAMNEAEEDGGGIYAEDGASIRIVGNTSTFGGDPDAAALLFANQAERGGAIFATDEGTEIFLRDTDLRGNSAEHGGGIYVTSEATVEFGSRLGAGECKPVTTEGAIITIPPCNRLINNHAEQQGGAAYVHDGGHLIVNDAYISGNSAESGEVIYAFNTADPGTIPDPKVEIENTLMTGNGNAATPGQSLILGDWYSQIEVRWSTMAGNFDADSSGAKITMNGVILADASLTLVGSILWSENEDVALVERGHSNNNDVTADCMIGHLPADDTGILASNLQYYSQIDPEFINADTGNFRLSPTSPAIDYCNDQPVPDFDLEGRERDVVFGGDTTEAPNAHPDGIHDIGAFTAQEAEIFQDRFEEN